MIKSLMLEVHIHEYSCHFDLVILLIDVVPFYTINLDDVDIFVNLRMKVTLCRFILLT